jgi:hypothetical protein
VEELRDPVLELDAIERPPQDRVGPRLHDFLLGPGGLVGGKQDQDGDAPRVG